MNICVYCGSSSRVKPAFFEAANYLGRIFAEENITLVYGAGAVGLMGEVAGSVLANGGRVKGVIPRFMVEEGWCRNGLEELYITESMHERKHKMAQMSDAVVAMPGGCGTLEELLEIITWKQLCLFTKPIVILNIGGYFDSLVELMQRAVDENFMRNEHVRMWTVVNAAEDVLPAIRNTPEWDVTYRKFAAI
ncbi:MAG: TIGR00730 family Rossman fold protein [Prevotellaceae bacterium]|jgi:uncharacterized protein (TIGR00730 family)|nr:TIGR00730 family Rossman fold protein [Prevotellaceae bacterium]